MLVLIVDDSPVTRELVRDILETNGHEIIEAADGISALRQIEEHRPQVVLLDIEIPHLDGYEVIRRIRESPPFADLRVAAFTAHAMTNERERALQAGFNDYITKPFRPAVLRTLISRLTA
jgi:two-component system cell cycle response regulator DivK